MGAITKYEGPAKLYVDSRLLAEAASVSARVTKNNRRVYTMLKGMSGKSSGPEESELTIESAIPRAGYERDFLALLQSQQEIRVELASGGKTRVFSVTVDEFEQTNSADAAATFRVTLSGPGPTTA